MTGSANQRFLREVEHNIVQKNREILSARLGTLTRTRMNALAQGVAEVRADYLSSALGEEWSKDADLSGLAEKRRRYEEALAAFDALERAVERGYVEIDERT